MVEDRTPTQSPGIYYLSTGDPGVVGTAIALPFPTMPHDPCGLNVSPL